MSELRTIPNVGKATERDLIAMGYTTVASLKGKTAGGLYAAGGAPRGFTPGRRPRYRSSPSGHYVNSEAPDSARCKWWLWKDEVLRPSPCGAVCADCARFPAACKGCRAICGKVYWLQYTGAARCAVYDCCVNGKKQTDCGGCPALPCERFTKDPTVSDEQNAANLARMLENLKKAEHARR